MISILTVDMPTDSYVTADEPSQLLGKHSFVFVCVSIICNQIRIEHNLFLSFNTMPIGKDSGYNLISNEHLKYADEKLHVLMSLLCTIHLEIVVRVTCLCQEAYPHVN